MKVKRSDKFLNSSCRLFFNKKIVNDIEISSVERVITDVENQRFKEIYEALERHIDWRPQIPFEPVAKNLYYITLASSTANGIEFLEKFTGGDLDITSKKVGNVSVFNENDVFIKLNNCEIIKKKTTPLVLTGPEEQRFIKLAVFMTCELEFNWELE